ncbi:formyl peptide receptor-related sequence 4-like [Anomaloglossus baeobatrachus]|uniref:formyl peptide receptor-related sequence 4-like n=1 Tax=Anomaloglossus baeobatrachus TaxID=238106 RepID=UPI003F504D24
MNDSLINGSYNFQDVNSTSNNQSTRQILRIVVNVIVYIFGTIINGFVIWSCILKMKKTVDVVWILNLAIADFTFAFFIPLRITYLALDNHWLFGNFMCQSYWFLYTLNVSVTVLQLMVISVDRYICIYFEDWCENHRKTSSAVIIAVIIWMFSFLASFPYFLIRNIFTNQDDISCSKVLEENHKWSATIISNFLFFLPFTVIVLCYAAIAVRNKRRGTIISSRPFKLFLGIIILFILCFFPYNLFLLLQRYGPHELSNGNKTRKIIAICLSTVNSCINPILYSFIGQNFKKDFITSVSSVLNKALRRKKKITGNKKEQRAGDGNSHVAYEETTQ